MQVKYTYPYKVPKLTSCFQVVTFPDPSNNSDLNHQSHLSLWLPNLTP